MKINRLISPEIFDKTKIISAVSTRKSGVSTSPFHSLNLGKSTSDTEENIIQNRKLFFDDLGIKEANCAWSYQVHGTEILEVNEPIRTKGFDGLITAKKNIFLVVSLADCNPVLIHEEEKNIIAALHSGWKGTCENITGKALEKIIQLGGNPKACKIYIGPGISFDHFEVGEEVAVQFDEKFCRKADTKGKYFIDLKSVILHQCLSMNIVKNNIEISEYCTFRDDSLFFSHRRDKGITGRMIAVIGMKLL